jgi:hypothetical protein
VDVIAQKCRDKLDFHVYIVIPLYPETHWASSSGQWSGLNIIHNQFSTFEYMYKQLKERGIVSLCYLFFIFLFLFYFIFYFIFIYLFYFIF